MLHTNATDGNLSQVGGFGVEIQAAVETELEMILAAPAFSQSSRCKKFLSHVVRHALSGKADQLKERIIGSNVFDRACDYDTGEDSIVRVTANEVRKRIGQFYQESRASHRIKIDLPRGSYIPEFTIHPFGHEGEALAPENPSSSHPSGPVIAAALTGEPQEAPNGHADAASSPPAQIGHAEPRRLPPSVFRAVVAVSLVVIAAGVLFVGIRNPAIHTKYPEVWWAFRQSKVPVLVCLGTHDLPIPKSATSAETEDVVMRKETIPIDDATVLASIARSLASSGIPFRLVAAQQASITDLQMQPVILIGAVDNNWTLQLTQSLRYRIAVEFPLGPNHPPSASIFDSEQPSISRWHTDFSVPLSAWKSDYAIVARENDATLGVPVLIEAGLGNSGSLAASEFVTSGSLSSALAGKPGCGGKSNFEAVIGTDIIDTRPGPPHVLRLTCW